MRMGHSRDLGRIQRFAAVGVLAARIYLGYKAISVRERYLGLRAAEVKRSAYHRRSAAQAYRLAVKLKGLMIKAGQIIASRADLVPEEYVLVLSRLLDEVPPKPYPVMERMLVEELKRPVNEVFAEFDRQPIAAASLAQVHKARLKDGRLVAVKIQYPGIWDIVQTDLRTLRFLLSLATRMERGLNFRPIQDELSDSIPKELDFINEGRNMEAIAANFAGRPNIIVPEVIWKHTTRRVLTMEFLDGIKITDVAAMEAAGIDVQAVAQLVIDTFCEQIFLHGIFHADPHPGNLFVQPGPRLVLLDFGQCRRLSDPFRLGFAHLAEAILNGNPGEIPAAFRALGFQTRDADPAPLLLLGKAFLGVTTPGRSYVDPELFAQANARLSRALRANPLIHLPQEFVFIMRVLGLLSGLGKRLDSRVNLITTMLPFARTALEKQSA